MSRDERFGTYKHLPLPTNEDTPEFTGGSVAYYQVRIPNPTTPGREAYTAECNDIIEALAMTYAEGNIFKAVWRICAERQGKGKRGYERMYDAEKIEFFAIRLLEQMRGKETE